MNYKPVTNIPTKIKIDDDGDIKCPQNLRSKIQSPNVYLVVISLEPSISETRQHF